MRGKESEHTNSYIQTLKGYQNILGLGVDDTTSAIIAKNGNVRFSNPEILGTWSPWGSSEKYPSTFTAYGKGVLRSQTSGTPAVIKRYDQNLFSGNRNLDEEALLFLWRRLITVILKNKFDLSQKEINTLKLNEVESNPEFLVNVFKFGDAGLRDKIIETLGKNILDDSGDIVKELLVDILKENPGQFAILSRRIPQDIVDGVIELAGLDDEKKKELKGDVSLQKDLDDLGF